MATSRFRAELESPRPLPGTLARRLVVSLGRDVSASAADCSHGFAISTAATDEQAWEPPRGSSRAKCRHRTSAAARARTDSLRLRPLRGRGRAAGGIIVEKRMDFGHHARRLPTADCRFIWHACPRLPTLQAAEAEAQTRLAASTQVDRNLAVLAEVRLTADQPRLDELEHADDLAGRSIP